ncbi:hypothetical protein ACO0LM_22995 [Undibacterium sp. Di26W]|uniref:hypothetical protein n=1 Tax=Undibacterium sp. Di26W TaxID=3413035 RepID=UPI003BF18E76
MMKSAEIKNGVVINVVIGYVDGYIPIDDIVDVQIGDLYDGLVFTKKPIPQKKIPQVVTMRQARLALLNAGLLDHVETVLATLPGTQGDTARIEWEFSSTVERRKQLVVALTPVLGMTDAQMDQLFITAATL